MNPEEIKEVRASGDRDSRLADAYAHKAMMALDPAMREFYLEREVEYLHRAAEWYELADREGA